MDPTHRGPGNVLSARKQQPLAHHTGLPAERTGCAARCILIDRAVDKRGRASALVEVQPQCAHLIRIAIQVGDLGPGPVGQGQLLGRGDARADRQSARFGDRLAGLQHKRLRQQIHARHCGREHHIQQALPELVIQEVLQPGGISQGLARANESVGLRAILEYLGIEAQHIQARVDLRVEAVNPLLVVQDPVAIAVDTVGVGQHPGAQRLIGGIKCVNEQPAARPGPHRSAQVRRIDDRDPMGDFLAIKQAVPVAVGLERVGVGPDFEVVGQSIGIGVRIDRVCAEGDDLIKIGQSVVVRVRVAIVGVAAATGLAAQPVAIRVAQRREAWIPRQRIAVIAAVNQIVEFRERVWKHIELHVVDWDARRLALVG